MTDPTPTPPTDGPTPDAPPTVDPAVRALYRPPYAPGVLRLELVVRVTPTALWAELPAFPGLFATGETVPELGVSLGQAVEAFLLEHTRVVPVEPDAPTEEPA